VASASSSKSGFSPRSSLREKSTGTVTANCTLPSASQFVDFRRAMRLARDVEIAAVAQTPDQGARKRAVVRRINRRGQVLGIGVDGVAEQDELDHRDADHHAERQPVAPHLDELLQHDGPKPPEAECARFNTKEGVFMRNCPSRFPSG
jgi:hypothetical protein